MARAARFAATTWLAVSAAFAIAFLVWLAVGGPSAERTALLSAEDVKDIERAYVRLELREKGSGWTEGSSFHRCETADTPAGPEPACYRLHVQIANSGSTAAHIEGGGIQSAPLMDETPFTPPVRTPEGRGAIAPAFLDARTRYVRTLTYHLAPDDLRALRDNRLWLVGYVDYVDAFGVRHRAGFCHRVSPEEKEGRNRLLVDAACSPHNQDRPPGEKTGQVARRYD